MGERPLGKAPVRDASLEPSISVPVFNGKTLMTFTSRRIVNEQQKFESYQAVFVTPAQIRIGKQSSARGLALAL
ncbi:MAG: hypothetical protein RL500_1667 [Pseudomonadota bacterium]|jgi:hypothetical protein